MAVAVSEPSDTDSQFRIEASGAFYEPRTRILKHGDTFAVLSPFGDMVGDAGCPDGLYHQDTRFLSQLELRLNGDRPLLLRSNQAEDNSLLPVDLANADTVAVDGSPLQRELIYSRRQFIWRSAYYELLLIRNFDLRRHMVTLGMRFAADFADIFEVRGQKRAQRGKDRPNLDRPMRWRYAIKGSIGPSASLSSLSHRPPPGSTITAQLSPWIWGRANGAGSRCGSAVIRPNVTQPARRTGPSASSTGPYAPPGTLSELKRSGRQRRGI